MRYAPVLCIITPLLLFTLPSKAMAYEKGTAATATKGTATTYTKKKKRYYRYKKSRKYSRYASRRAVSAPAPSAETMAAIKAEDNAPLPQQPVRTWTLISPWPMPPAASIDLTPPPSQGEASLFPTERFEAVFKPEVAPKADKLKVQPDVRWRLLPWVAGIIAFILVLCGSIFIPLIRFRKEEPEPKPRTEPKLFDHAANAASVIFLNQHRRRRA